MRLQEVIPSELQFVSLEARKALVCFKYLPLPAQLVGPVMATLEQVGCRAVSTPMLRVLSLSRNAVVGDGVMFSLWWRDVLRCLLLC